MRNQDISISKYVRFTSAAFGRQINMLFLAKRAWKKQALGIIREDVSFYGKIYVSF